VHKPIAIAADYATGFCTLQVLLWRQERSWCVNGRLRTPAEDEQRRITYAPHDYPRAYGWSTDQ